MLWAVGQVFSMSQVMVGLPGVAGQPQPLHAPAPPVWFPESTYVFEDATSRWLSVESFLLKDCTQGVSSSGIHVCIGKTVESYFENILYSVQPGGRKQGADISVVEVFRQTPRLL